MIRSALQTARNPLATFRPIALALPLFLLLAVSTAVTAHAAVICVPNDAIDGSCTAGQGQLTIQAGINAAVSGVDTVLVGAGTYNENLTLGKNIPLVGAQSGVPACGRVATESIITAASGILLELQAGSAGARINGFHFSGGARGIESTGGPIDGISIRFNRFTGFTGAGVFLNNNGIDISVDNNEIIGSSKTGTGGSFHLDTDAFDGFQFTNNCVKDAPLGSGFFVDGNRNVGLSAGQAPLFDGNLFENHVTNVGVNIGSRAVEDATFSNNVFRLNGFDGLQGGPLRTAFTNNTFDRNGRNGLVMTSFGNQTAGRGSNAVTISGNCFVNNGLTPPPPPAPTPPAGAGLRFSLQPEPQGTSVFNKNDFMGNLPGAINVNTDASDTIDGTNNFWNAVSGPSGVGPGSGDIVSGPPTPGTGIITFSPFSTVPQSFPGSLCNPFTPTPTPSNTPTPSDTPTPTNTPTDTPTNTPTPPPLAVSITDPFGCTNNGNVLDVEVVVFNAGGPLFMVTVQSTLPAGLTGVAASCTFVGGSGMTSCTVSPGDMTWTGDIPANSGLTINYQVQVGAGVAVGTPLCIDTEVSSDVGSTSITECTAVDCPAPTGVDLRYFRAIGLADRTLLVWETAAEVDTLGFNITRAASTDGPWTLVNRTQIPAEGGAATGGAYVLRDAPGPGTWTYRLEEVGADGKRTLHSAITAQVGANSGGREIFVPRVTTTRAGQAATIAAGQVGICGTVDPTGLTAVWLRWENAWDRMGN